MNEYIYCKNDIKSALNEVLKDEFSYGYNLCEFIVNSMFRKLDLFVNWYRFIDKNCAGCASSPDECEVQYSNSSGKDWFKQIQAGKLFICPVRCNGTFMLGENGLESIDISDRKKTPYPVINPEASNE